MKKNVLIILISFLVTICSFASTVSLTVVQNESAPKVSYPLSHKIEGILMDTFFNMGEIVTNDTLKFDYDNYENKSFGIKQAINGMADYLLVTRIEYDPIVLRDSEGKEYPDLKKIEFRLVKLSNKTIITEDKIEKKDFLRKGNNFEETASLMAEHVARESYKKLQKNKAIK